MADDVFQDTSLVAIRGGAQLEEVRDLMAWLKGVARKKAIRAYGKRTREVFDATALELAQDEAPDSERGASARQLAGRALHGLSESSAEVVFRRHVLGENATEIASSSGQTGAGVRMKLKRALRGARDSLGSDPGPSE